MKTAILTAIGATVVNALPASIQEFQSTLTSIDSQGIKFLNSGDINKFHDD